MRISMHGRLAAVIAIAGTSITLSCGPVRLGSLVESMTAAEQAAAIAMASWVNCVTVRRVAVAPGDSTDVEICADTGAKKYGPTTPPSGYGKPVAKMRNLGDHVEDRWNLVAGGTYIVWLSGPPGGPTRWTIKGHGMQISGPFVGCGYHAADTSKANFGNCMENPAPVVTRSIRRGPAEHAGSGKDEHILLDRATGPAWISCTAGCCTTEAQ